MKYNWTICKKIFETYMELLTSGKATATVEKGRFGIRYEINAGENCLKFYHLRAINKVEILSVTGDVDEWKLPVLTVTKHSAAHKLMSAAITSTSRAYAA